MGLNIYLYANFRGIEPEQWESAYQESVKLLNHFPVPLMRLAKDNKHGHDCHVFTTDIFCEVGSDWEHWRFCGDMTSYRYAESFQMYRHLDIVRGNDNGSINDVLWSDEDNIHYLTGNGRILFNEKTQGYPYHLAVLAVAILFESRFPENCYLLVITNLGVYRISTVETCRGGFQTRPRSKFPECCIVPYIKFPQTSSNSYNQGIIYTIVPTQSMATRKKCKSTAFALLQQVTPKSVITRKYEKRTVSSKQKAVSREKMNVSEGVEGENLAALLLERSGREKKSNE